MALRENDGPDDRAATMRAAYDAWADALFRHCYFRVSDRERARDLVQSVFMKTWEYVAERTVPVANMRALLYRIAHNMIVDEYRKKKTASLDALTEETGFQPAAPDDTDHAALDARRTVTGLMGRLSEENRQIVTMRYLEGMSPKEIGAILGMKENTVSARVHRALRVMRESGAAIDE